MLGVKIGKIVLEETNSTNSYSKSNINNIEDRTAVIAKRQTSGRGRLNRSWIDLGEGNLFMTLVLKPSDKYSPIYSNLTQYLSVSLCKVLEFYGLQPQIKWPNDVLINNKKIAGILAETVMLGNSMKGLLLGIGVNLNADEISIKNITDKKATSMNLKLNKEINIEEFTDKLLETFFKDYDKFLQTGFEQIKKNYICRSCFLNKQIKVQGFNKITEGTAQEINDNGELVILTDKNNRVILTIGDIL